MALNQENSIKTYLTSAQKKAFKVKTIQEETTMSEVVAAAIDLYLAGKLELPTRQTT